MKKFTNDEQAMQADILSRQTLNDMVGNAMQEIDRETMEVHKQSRHDYSKQGMEKTITTTVTSTKKTLVDFVDLRNAGQEKGEERSGIEKNIKASRVESIHGFEEDGGNIEEFAGKSGTQSDNEILNEFRNISPVRGEQDKSRGRGRNNEGKKPEEKNRTKDEGSEGEDGLIGYEDRFAREIHEEDGHDYLDYMDERVDSPSEDGKTPSLHNNKPGMPVVSVTLNDNGRSNLLSSSPRPQGRR